MWPIQILPTVDVFFVILILLSCIPFIHHASNNYFLCPSTQPSCRCPTNPSLQAYQFPLTAYSSALKTETADSLETFVPIHQIRKRNVT
jgi:hypothetical protein